MQRVPEREIFRWSLKALSDNQGMSSSSSEFLLRCVVDRLSYQQLALQDVLRWAPTERNAMKSLETMEYIHKDTCRLGQNVLKSPRLWERFSSADRHVVNSTFLELRSRHANSVETSVDVLYHLKHHWQSNHKQQSNDAGKNAYQQLHDSMENFLRRRLGIQLLCDHHVELYERSKSIVTLGAPIHTFVENAVTEAQHIVDAHLQIVPEVSIRGQAFGAVIRPWLHHSLVEVLKNAMASVVAKANQHETGGSQAPVTIFIDQDDDGIFIEIMDRGVGIQNEEQITGLGHSSQDKRWDRLDEQQSYAAVRSPLSSLGVGLKVARYQMEHFGGTLHLENNSDGAGGCMVRIFLPADLNLQEQFPLHDWLTDQKIG